MPTFNDYREFAKRKARSAGLKDAPTKLELQNLPKKDTYNVVARNYHETFTPHDKTKPVVITGRGVILDRQYYHDNRNNPQEIKQAIIHELAHQVTGHAVHNENFREAAKKLGADANHQKPYWQ